jgi:hypothetical protein
MIYYSFAINIRRDSEKTEIIPYLGVSNPEYAMLHYLHEYNRLVFVDDVLQNIAKVKNGAQEAYAWGQDWCLITSLSEQSTIQYYNHEIPDWLDKPLFIEIPTAWLVTMMQDWRVSNLCESRMEHLNYYS